MHPTRKYKKNFLKKVIARVDFAKDIDLGEKGPSTSFISALKSFPVSGLNMTVNREVKILADSTEESRKTFEEWSYRSKSGHKRAVITRKCFFIEYEKYNTYESLRSEFLGALERLFKDVPNIVIGRLGLRYVNHIELDEPKPTSWSKYLVPELTASFNLAEKAETVSRAFNVLEFSYPDETKLRFQFGMPNPDYPSPIKRKLFVLDYDGYSQMIIPENEVSDYLDVFHYRVNRAFEQVVTDAARRKLEPK